MGQYYRALYVRPGFLEEKSGCPAPGDLFAWADKTVRTRATADAILAGLFPGCTKPEDVSASFDPQNADVLFHPIAAGVAPLDPEAAKTAVLAAMGGSFEAAKQRLSSDFDRLAAVLHGPRPETCAKDGLGSSCRLIDLPWSISIDSAKGHSLSLKGPLQMASAVAETIRLEYAQGMSADQVGWGRVAGAEGVTSLLALHKALYDVSLRVPPIAQRGASQILNQIALALEQGPGAEPAGGPPPAKLVLFVGHDTNMAHMQATLGVHWKLPGYPENDTVPGGALVFERLRDMQTGERFLRLAYTAQSMNQIRNLTPLTGEAKPERTVLSLPGCKHESEPGACRFGEGLAAIRGRIDPTATSVVAYPTANARGR
jgi:4-phytase/acid phosphatase